MVWPFDTDPGSAPAAPSPDGGGWLTDTFSSPWATLPYIAGTALLSAASPMGARAANVINTGMGLGLNIENARQKEQKQQRLSEALGPVINAKTDTTTTKPGVNPFDKDVWKNAPTVVNDTGNQPLPANTVRLSEVGSLPRSPATPSPTYQTTKSAYDYTEPQRNLLNALVKSGDSAGAMKVMDTLATRRDAVPPRPGGGLIYDKASNSWVPNPYATPAGGAPHIIQTPEGTFRVPTAMGEPAQKVEGITGKTATEPPALTDSLAIAIEGKVNRGVPLNKREMDALGVSDPDQAKQVVQEMARIKQSRNVDSRTAIAEAVGAVNAGFRRETEAQRAEDKKTALDEKRADKAKVAEAFGEDVDTAFSEMETSAGKIKTASGPAMQAGAAGGIVGGIAQGMSGDARLGAAYDSTRQRFGSFYDRAVGGLRAAASLPFQRFTAEKLTPNFYDAPSTVDFKLETMHIIKEALKDAKKREVSGQPPDPEITKKLATLGDKLDAVIASPQSLTPAPPAPTGRPGPPRPGAQAGPSVGTVSKGYRFKGGDPASQQNWEKVTK